MARMSGSIPPGKKSELRTSMRFRVDDAVPLVYEKGLLSSLGIGRTNQARAAISLSEGGILVRTHDKMKTGTKVKVRLEIEKFKDVIEAEGVVRWCFQSAKEQANYYAGIRFTKVAPPVATKIAALRGYFTSPEYRSRSASRRKPASPMGVEFD